MTAQQGSTKTAERRIAERRVGPAERRKNYRRGLGRYDRRITGAEETELSEEVQKMRTGSPERRGAVRIRRREPEERRVAERRLGPGGEGDRRQAELPAQTFQG